MGSGTELIISRGLLLRSTVGVTAMSGEKLQDLDKVFKALGHVTRRRILQLLAQNPRYAYELSKMLELNRRVVLKHLEALEDAGLIGHEAGESELGPDRTYYRLNVSFGLSTTILPNAFVIGLTQRSRNGTSAAEARLPRDDADVQAVRRLLSELDKTNTRLNQLDEERMHLAVLRGQIIARIERIMLECSWDQKSCQRVRTLIDPLAEVQGLSRFDVLSPNEAIQEALSMFERLMRSGVGHSEDDDHEEEDDLEIETK
jgi:predicted transcriptional regulator